MKRGKDDEKIMGPMFPRLHVNDTEKGGPRAPPRNKMALYEQLSIPSQRFNHGVLPLNPNNSASVVPQHPQASDKEPKQTSIISSNLRQGRSQDEKNPKEMTEGPRKQTDAPAGQEHRDRLANNFDRIPSTGTSLNHESRARAQLQNSMCGIDVSNEPARGVENGFSSILRRDSCPEELRSPNTNGSGYHEDKTSWSVQAGNGERGDDASETSMVDSISGMDISPDDVVGIIGQKHFWKARKAIVNQQRVFAVQVFELHRLIKVQRSIAGSPHLLLEDGAYLGEPLKASSARKLPLEYIVKPSPQIAKHKDDSDNPNRNMECSAENAVGKTSLSSAQHVSQPSICKQFSGNPLSTTVTADSKLSPCFHQPPTGHQWLIPVMSPSEGLIYKPYPGHGFMGPAFGSCGPPGSNPMMGNFVNPAYSVPSPHHHYQGIGVPPTSPPVGHSYFPPYGMPVINPVFSGLASQPGQSGQLSGLCNVLTAQKNGGVIPNVVRLRASKESELQGSTASSPGERALGFGVGPATNGRNALPLFPTSPSTHTLDEVPQLHDVEQPATRVIKVVPHNARSATESVARIFQSIQEERKQYDSA
ncbi:Protein EARLY FLOWERING 3 [Camellia lanceoleosa]|uniref:Protein EARLY FLOWERING 3 n=1 Tax=Camellia lanceoleosa TaxID=1840588 RepID=A0ACC0FXQ3_9ERIC|nr:Protein EARLY FLOWERING 3 [Camellia lanceoleosa]